MPSATSRLIDTHRVLGLAFEVEDDLAAVRAGPVEHVEVRELRHGDAEERARLAVPVPRAASRPVRPTMSKVAR